jgi:hypothetical protein
VATGTVQVGPHSLELPEDEARALFLVASTAAKRGGAMVVSPDTTMILNPATPISLTIAAGFIDEYDPLGQLDRITTRRQHVRRIS